MGMATSARGHSSRQPIRRSRWCKQRGSRDKPAAQGRKVMCAVLMIAVLAVAVPDREDPTPKEKARPLQEQLLGEWLLVKSVVGGVEDKNFMGTTITFTPTELSIREGRQELSQELSYHLDAAKTPAVIDLV